MKKLLTFKTRNLNEVSVYDTETDCFGERIYSIMSVDNRGKELIRFGNATQTLSILNGYKYGVRQCDGYAEYEAFMERHYYRGEKLG